MQKTNVRLQTVGRQFFDVSVAIHELKFAKITTDWWSLFYWVLYVFSRRNAGRRRIWMKYSWVWCNTNQINQLIKNWEFRKLNCLFHVRIPRVLRFTWQCFSHMTTRRVLYTICLSKGLLPARKWHAECSRHDIPPGIVTPNRWLDYTSCQPRWTF